MIYETHIESMINKVVKKKELTREAAIHYMLNVATGRLAALWRYDSSLPEGKTSKGVLAVKGNKKVAERAEHKAIELPQAKAPKAPKAKRVNAKRVSDAARAKVAAATA